MQRSRRSWIRMVAVAGGFLAMASRVRADWFWRRFRLDPILPPPITVNPVDDESSKLDPTQLDGPAAELSEQLEAGLLARQDAEFAFLHRVALMVQNGQLPEELVTSTFQWARNKRPYPFPYFKKALQVRAARKGIKVR